MHPMHAFFRFRQRFFYFDATEILCLGSDASVATWRLFSIEKWHIEKFRAVSSMQLENEGLDALFAADDEGTYSESDDDTDDEYVYGDEQMEQGDRDSDDDMTDREPLLPSSFPLTALTVNS
jgi:hypothetical protein